MTRLWICLTALLLNLGLCAHGYMIDQDCGDDTAFVQSKVDAAFRLIANAVTELQKSPINIDIDNWFNTLFGRPASQLSDNQVLSRMRNLGEISQRSINDQDQSVQDENGIKDVRFYCTTKRIVKTEDGYRFKNKDRDRTYDTNQLESRFAHCYDLAEPTLMITMRFPGSYSEIQICPWYLRNARGRKFTDLVNLDQPFYTTFSKLAIPVVAKMFYTPIDTFVLTDKVIVHELTHTHQARPSTVDFKGVAYGFKNALKIVQNWKSDANLQNDPQKNADSNALFVIGTWIIGKSGSAIKPDGSFTAPRATPKARSLPG